MAEVAALNTAVDAVASSVTDISLHTTDGGSDGSGELTGGSYARQTPSYANSSGGSADLSAALTFGGPGSSSNVTHTGYWAGSTWLGSAALTTPRTVTSADTIDLTSAPISATSA